MKKHLKVILITIILILLFIIIYFVYRRVSLNKYLDLTIEYSDKINYSTNIQLSISKDNFNQKFVYNIDKSSYIKRIMISNYTNDDLVSSIIKCIVSKGSKKGEYTLINDKYFKSKDSVQINVDYKKLKDDIISVKSKRTKKIKDKKYIEYIVKAKGYNAYNLIYDKEILTKEEYNKDIYITILIDKENNFIYNISYTIENINLSSENKFNYRVDIINSKINNSEKISLPF